MNNAVFVVVDFDNQTCPVQGVFDSEDSAQAFIDENYSDLSPVGIQKFGVQ
jgi:hypothetical protein